MSSNLLEFTFSSYSTWRDFCCCCYFIVFWWKMSRVGKSSATLRVSETFKEQGGHALKSELKLFSLLNALHSLGSGLFYLAFEVLLSFKLNSSWSVTNLLEKLRFFKRNIETRAFPWEYWISVPVLFFPANICPAWKHILLQIRGFWYCFSTKLTRTSKVNTLKGRPIHPADRVMYEFRSKCTRLLPLMGQGTYHHLLRFRGYWQNMSKSKICQSFSGTAV